MRRDMLAMMYTKKRWSWVEVVASGARVASSLRSWSQPRKYLALPLADFPHRSPSLVDGCVGIGFRSGIGIGNRDAAEGLAPDHTRSPFGSEVWVPQRTVFVGIA